MSGMMHDARCQIRNIAGPRHAVYDFNLAGSVIEFDHPSDVVLSAGPLILTVP